MATAYAGIANNGVACSPIAIDKVVASNGTAHCRSPRRSAPQPRSTRVSRQRPSTPSRASCAAAERPHPRTRTTACPIFGKTGTTDNSIENWLVTSTTKVAQATWVGNVQGQVALRSQTLQRGRRRQCQVLHRQADRRGTERRIRRGRIPGARPQVHPGGGSAARDEDRAGPGRAARPGPRPGAPGSRPTRARRADGPGSRHCARRAAYENEHAHARAHWPSVVAWDEHLIRLGSRNSCGASWTTWPRSRSRA